MKRFILLAFGIIIAILSAHGQNPLAEVEIIRIWNTRKDVPATPGTSYKWKVPGDTAYYFTPVPGQEVYATITFTPVTVTKVVDDPELTFVPSIHRGVNVSNGSGWNHYNADVAPSPQWCLPFYNHTGSFAIATGATVSYTFIGTKLRVYGEKSNNKGIAGVKIDSNAETTIDLYAPTTVNNSQLIYSATLPSGTHTITMRVTGQKNSASVGYYLLVDKIEFE